VQFISLQKKVRPPPRRLVRRAAAWSCVISPRISTTLPTRRALIENLDLIISFDTAVVRLADALGKPVWLLDRFDTSRRWLQNRDDPSLRHTGAARRPRPTSPMPAKERQNERLACG